MLFIELKFIFYRSALDEFFEIIGEARYFNKEKSAVAIVADALDFVPNQKKCAVRKNYFKEKRIGCKFDLPDSGRKNIYIRYFVSRSNWGKIKTTLLMTD